jgi:hypothetical protein
LAADTAHSFAALLKYSRLWWRMGFHIQSTTLDS